MWCSFIRTAKAGHAGREQDMTITQAARRVAGERAPTERTGRAAPRRTAFWLLALVLTVTMLGTTLPTPLYVIYQGRWHFSAAMVTVHQGSHAVQGAIVFLLLAVGTVTQVALARFSRRRVILARLSPVVAALGLIVAALAESAMPLFL